MKAVIQFGKREKGKREKIKKEKRKRAQIMQPIRPAEAQHSAQQKDKMRPFQ
jgi:hypothetical protein